MASNPILERPRGEWRFEGFETFSETLGGIGAWVGPRLGPDRRTKEQRELFCLRRYLVALKLRQQLSYPFTVTHLAAGAGPDFLLRFQGQSPVGLEVTEASDEAHQREMTESEDSGDLCMHEIWPEEVIEAIGDAIRKKLNKGADGCYGREGPCDLLIYDNTRSGDFVDYPGAVLNALHAPNGWSEIFRRIHILCGETIHFDVFGPNAATVKVSGDYDIDFGKWIGEQVNAIRAARGDGLDVPHLIEELESMGRADKRAFGSQLVRLIKHLLKWDYQPEKTTPSWKATIINARDEIAALVADNPSFSADAFLKEQISASYARAIREASVETGLAPGSFPESCPYSAGELFDQDFLPGTQEGPRQ